MRKVVSGPRLLPPLPVDLVDPGEQLEKSENLIFDSLSIIFAHFCCPAPFPPRNMIFDDLSIFCYNLLGQNYFFDDCSSIFTHLCCPRPPGNAIFDGGSSGISKEAFGTAWGSSGTA